MKETNILNKIENNFEGIFKSLPHLPEGGRKWIANHAGTIASVGLGLLILGLLLIIVTLFTTLSLTSSYMSAFGVAAYSSGWVIAAIVSLADVILTIILIAMAIKPLKSMTKKGWDLLFLSSLLSVPFSIVGSIINFEIISFITGLVGLAVSLAISMYFLFEIRSFFVKGQELNNIPKIPQLVK